MLAVTAMARGASLVSRLVRQQHHVVADRRCFRARMAHGNFCACNRPGRERTGATVVEPQFHSEVRLRVRSRYGRVGVGAASAAESALCIRIRVPPPQAHKVGQACGKKPAAMSPVCGKTVHRHERLADGQKDSVAGKPFHAFAQRCVDAAPSLTTQEGSSCNSAMPTSC